MCVQLQESNAKSEGDGKVSSAKVWSRSESKMYPTAAKKPKIYTALFDFTLDFLNFHSRSLTKCNHKSRSRISGQNTYSSLNSN